MSAARPVGVGLVGSGFLAETRARCYGRLPAPGARLVAVHSRDAERATAFVGRHGGTAAVCASLEALLGRDDVQLVDLCVPNHLHRPFTEAAAAAGKHVVCTKPLTAYVGQDLAPDAPDEAVSATPRARMLELAVADAEAMVAACRDAGVQLMYGENWLYAPSIRRAETLVRGSGAALLDLRGWECHSGSHSPYSKRWRHAGGGALIRLAAHPVGAMLHLKRVEGLARDGRPIEPVSVVADVAEPTAAAVAAGAPTEVATGWKDVESWGSISIAFSDGTRGLAIGSDTMLGGMQSRLVLLGSNLHLECNLSPNDTLRGYGARPGAFGDAYVMEKASTDAGWHAFLPDEDQSSGHLDMCAAFAHAVSTDEPATSDGALGLAVTRVVYGAYVSASEGRRVAL